MSQKSNKNGSIRSKLSRKSKNRNSVNEEIKVERIQSVKRNKAKKASKFCKISESKYLGFFLAFCATFCLTISYFIIKLSKSLNAAEMGSIKFSLTTFCCLIVSIFYKQNILGPKDTRFLLLARGFTGSIALVLNFFSIQLIAYGDSTVIRNISPVITAIFARIFLKEILNLSHFLSLFISFVGIMFVARPPVIFGKLLNSTSVKIDTNFILGVSLAVISTLAIGLAFIFIKKLTNKNVHFSVIIFYLSSIGSIISLITSITLYFTGVSHKNWELEEEFLTRDISLALTAGVLNFLGHICFTLAFVRENANTISIMRTLDIIIAFLLEFLIVGLVPDYFSLVGAALVITSVFVMIGYKIISDILSASQEKNVYEVKNNKDIVIVRI